MAIPALAFHLALALPLMSSPGIRGHSASTLLMSFVEDPNGGEILTLTQDGCFGTVNSDGEWVCLDGSSGGSGGGGASGPATCKASDYDFQPPCPVGCNYLSGPDTNKNCWYGGDALASTCDDGRHKHSVTQR